MILLEIKCDSPRVIGKTNKKTTITLKNALYLLRIYNYLLRLIINFLTNAQLFKVTDFQWIFPTDYKLVALLILPVQIHYCFPCYYKM